LNVAPYTVINPEEIVFTFIVLNAATLAVTEVVDILPALVDKLAKIFAVRVPVENEFVLRFANNAVCPTNNPVEIKFVLITLNNPLTPTSVPVER